MWCVDVLSVTAVTDNPVTVHGVDEGNMVPTTNRQFDYETVDSLDMDLATQYLSGRTQLLAEYCEDLVHKMRISREKAVEFGCGTGLATFLLTKTFKEVFVCFLLLLVFLLVVALLLLLCLQVYSLYCVCTHSDIKGTHVIFECSDLLSSSGGGGGVQWHFC